jgi:hypothetical protein
MAQARIPARHQCLNLPIFLPITSSIIIGLLVFFVFFGFLWRSLSLLS